MELRPEPGAREAVPLLQAHRGHQRSPGAGQAGERRQGGGRLRQGASGTIFYPVIDFYLFPHTNKFDFIFSPV